MELEEGEEEEEEGRVEEEKGQEGEQGKKMRQAQNIFHLDSTGIYWVKGQTKTFPLQG